MSSRPERTEEQRQADRARVSAQIKAFLAREREAAIARAAARRGGGGA